MDLKENIIENLREVYDPEIPINVYDLGLIYDIKISPKNNVTIIMTLTSPTCPTADYLVNAVEEAAKLTGGVDGVDVELTFEPKWVPDMINEDVREELGFPIESLQDTSKLHTQTNDQETKICMCFNCSITQDKAPLIQAKYKGEDVWICGKCLPKF